MPGVFPPLIDGQCALAGEGGSWVLSVVRLRRTTHMGAPGYPMSMYGGRGERVSTDVLGGAASGEFRARHAQIRSPRRFPETHAGKSLWIVTEGVRKESWPSETDGARTGWPVGNGRAPDYGTMAGVRTTGIAMNVALAPPR